MRLSNDLRAELRRFAFYLANRTLCSEVLRGVEYSPICSNALALEQTVAIYANVLYLDALPNPKTGNSNCHLDHPYGAMPQRPSGERKEAPRYNSQMVGDSEVIPRLLLGKAGPKSREVD